MNTYSIKITELEANKIKLLLENNHAVFDTVQYSIWRAKTADYQVIYYTSGKLLIQGKNISFIISEIESVTDIRNTNKTNQAILNYSQTEHLPSSSEPQESSKYKSNIIKKSLVTATYSEKLSEHYIKAYIGTDESGKGDFFGPLVAAGVQINEKNKNLFINAGIKDSKKLDDEKVKKLSVLIKNNSVHSIIVITPKKYNELYSKFKNLNKLLAWAHARAIENILEKSPCEYALADKFGDESLIKNALLNKGKNIILNQMVRAEEDIAVAAASVIARAEFVKRIDEMEIKYGIKFPKGASDKVIVQAKSFIEKYTFSELNEVAKMHFKTIKNI